MLHLDLFSGIGGFALAARWAGWQTIGFVEIDPFCQKVLAKHWPGVQIESDIRQVTGRTFRERPDIITGGFPCQDISVANPDGAGLDGNRSGLWFEMLRLIEVHRPAWVVGENVANYARLDLDRILDGLEATGYEAIPFDIPSCAVGLPTMERHIWIVAAPKGAGLAGNGTRALSNEPRVPMQLRGGNSRSRDGWDLSKSRVCGVGEGIPNRLERTHALGNAIPPAVAYEIFKAIELT